MKNWEKYGIDIRTSRTSGNVKVICPECHERRSDKHDKSLSCDLATGMFHCHYCGFSGCAEEQTEEEKQEWMRQQPWYNPKPIRKEKPVYRKPTPKPAGTMSDKAVAYFQSRGISKATLDLMKITEGLEYMPQKQTKFNTVQFNYFKNGELVNTKFRTADKCFKMVQGAELLPYNIDGIKGEKECIITEGEMDALSFVECGFRNVVSVPNGANANLEYLDDYIEDYFDDKDTIFIASDTDSKGVMLRDELLRRFGAERCRVLDYGNGCKDANELLQKSGKQALIDCLNAAPEVKLEGIFTVSDFEQSLDALFENGLPRGVITGHDNFDRLCSFETKRLCLVTGIPGSGKSEFIDEIAERLNIRYGWRFAYFSPENAPLAYHASKLIEKFTGKRFNKNSLSLPEYRQVKQHLEKNFFFISPKEDYRLDTILERAKFLVRRKGIKCVVIDPFNRLEDESGNQNETRYISKLLDKLTNFAQLNDVLVVLMAHPTKMKRTAEGQPEVPTLYDISGSAHFYNKCDFGIVVHRDRVKQLVQVNVQKVKFRHLGEVGTALFKYNYENGRYTPFYDETDIPNDNSNHLIEDIKERQKEAQELAKFEFPEPNELEDECPF